MAYQALIIGLGQIGADYDLKLKDAILPLTHLKAMQQNKNFEIKALVDTNDDQRKKVEKFSKLSADVFYKEIPHKPLDIAVFCCSPAERIKQLRDVVACRPKVIVFEKPLATNNRDAQEIKSICDEAGIRSVVNFHRRYDHDHTIFHEQLPKEPPYKIIFHYTKGIWNYGSHGIDLITNWFGAVKEVRGHSATGDGDPLVDGTLLLESGVIVNLIGHSGNYDMFDIEIFYSNSKYSLLAGGIDKISQSLEKDRYHSGYNHLGDRQDICKPSKVYGLKQLYEDISKACDEPEYSLKGCTLDEAISNVEIITQLTESTR